MESDELIIDAVYKISHLRKGAFSIKVKEFDDEWVTGEIVDGETKTMLPENSKSKGELVTVRKSFCSFKRL